MTDDLVRKFVDGRLDPDECDVLLSYIVDAAAMTLLLGSLGLATYG